MSSKNNQKLRDQNRIRESNKELSEKEQQMIKETQELLEKSKQRVYAYRFYKEAKMLMVVLRDGLEKLIYINSVPLSSIVRMTYYGQTGKLEVTLKETIGSIKEFVDQVRTKNGTTIPQKTLHGQTMPASLMIDNPELIKDLLCYYYGWTSEEFNEHFTGIREYDELLAQIEEQKKKAAEQAEAQKAKSTIVDQHGNPV